MHRQQGCEAAEFHHKIPVGHRVHRVLRDHGFLMRVYKAQLARDKFPVQWQGAASYGAAAQRADIHPHQTIQQPLVIALKHFHIGQ